MAPAWIGLAGRGITTLVSARGAGAGRPRASRHWPRYGPFAAGALTRAPKQSTACQSRRSLAFGALSRVASPVRTSRATFRVRLGMSIPPRELARSPHAVSDPMRRVVARAVAGLVLWLCVFGVAAGSADAGALLFGNGSLVFTNEFNSDPDRSIDLEITESGEDLVFFSVGDVL